MVEGAENHSQRQGQAERRTDSNSRRGKRRGTKRELVSDKQANKRYSTRADSHGWKDSSSRHRQTGGAMGANADRWVETVPAVPRRNVKGNQIDYHTSM